MTGHMREERLDELAIAEASHGLLVEEEAELSNWFAVDQNQKLSECRLADYKRRVDLLAAVVLAGSVQTDVPAGHLDGVLAAIDESVGQSGNSPAKVPPAGFTYLLEKDSLWVDLPYEGCRIRTLTDHPEDPFTIVVLEMDPGSLFPQHTHKGVETAYLLSGDILMDGQMFRPGDFMRAAPGSDHMAFESPSGCQAMLVMARENYQRKTMTGLKALQGIKRWFRHER